MTYNHKIGNILDVKQGLIVHQVNAQGVMGSGIALLLRNKWPAVWEEYHKVVKQNQPDKGLSYMGHVIYVQVEPGLWVANVVGQQFYGSAGNYTSYEALEMAFHSINNFASNNELDVHYPLIGCGLAGGDWTRVSQIISDRLGTIDHMLWTLPSE